MLKKILIGIVLILVAIQFFRPAKNLSDDRTYDISKKYPVPENVQAVLEVACNDCHSNKTRYPWYINIQPVAWWMNDHVQDGKRHLNLSEFTRLPIAVQYHKFEEMVEMVEDGEMPLPSYTNLGFHSEAELTQAQRSMLIDWAKVQMDQMKATYPADSLRMKRSGRH